MASLHFRLVLGLQGWGEELVWAPPPRAWVLGGVQMRILEGRLCKTKEEWSPGGRLPVRAIGAGLMGRQRFLSDTERKRLYFKARAAPFCLGQP